MRKSIRHSLAGVTLTELLVVLAIIGLLATMSVPAVINHSAKAKFVAARADVETLAKAEEACGLIHGFYVPLQLLDDVPTPTFPDTNRDDYIGNELSRGIRLIDTEQSAYDQITFNTQPLLQTINSSTSQRVSNLVNKWQGPFINFQRFWYNSANLSPSSATVAHDHPLDPWGNPYRLYSPQGITGSQAGTNNTQVGSADMDQDSFSNGQLTSLDDKFDRYAIVSFGPNGLSDPLNTPLGGGSSTIPDFGDDVIFFFGANPADETSFQTIATPTP